MSLFQHAIIAVDFHEHPLGDPSKKEIHQFDVTIQFTGSEDERPLRDAYCSALLHKVFSLAHLELMPFFRYQCTQAADPACWLSSLEKLLAGNHHLFTTWQLRMKMELVLVHTTILFHEVEIGTFRKVKKYDISEVKKRLRTYRTSLEQLDYLYELKAEYLQDKSKVVDFSEMPFDQLLMIEVEKIEQFRNSLEKIKGKKAVSKNNLSDQYIDNQEFIMKMNISKRTAQFWRDKGIINFIQIGSKIYYKITDVETMLQQNYNKPINRKPS